MPAITINVTTSVSEGITAHAGGGQANAVVLSSHFNMIDTVASAGDSVKCNAATSGKVKEINNNGANDMDLYPAIGERFKNGTTLMAINDPLSIASGNGIKLVCYSNGVWRF